MKTHRDPWPELHELAVEIFGPVGGLTTPNTNPELLERVRKTILAGGEIAVSQIQIGFGRRTISNTKEHGKICLHAWHESMRSGGLNLLPHHTHGSDVDSVIVEGVIVDAQSHLDTDVDPGDATHKVFAANHSVEGVAMQANGIAGVLTDEREHRFTTGDAYQIPQGAFHTTPHARAITLVRFGEVTGTPVALGDIGIGDAQEFLRPPDSLATEQIHQLLAT